MLPQNILNQSSKKFALIISMYQYPNGDAGSVRQHAFANLLMENGYIVHLIGVTLQSTKIDGEYLGVQYTLYPKYHIHTRYKEYIQTYFQANGQLPEIILLTNITMLGFMYVRKFAIKSGITLIHDRTEWYSINEFIGKFYVSPKGIVAYIQDMLKYLLLFNNKLSMISISTYLDNYFRSKNIHSLRLPVIMDSNSFVANKNATDKVLHITYAGSPEGRKDYLSVMIQAFTKLSDHERSQIDFTLLGIDTPTLTDLWNITIEELDALGCIHALGRVPRTEVLERLKNTDFTILIRSSTARYAKAGFPTKVVESLMSSTPVILNMTSDLGMYLKDGYDCIEVEHEDPESIVKALRRALALTPEQKDQMKKNARKTAEENFDYRLYIDEFGKFINNES